MPYKKLTDDALADIQGRLAHGERIVDIAAIHGVKPARISQLKHGKKPPATAHEVRFVQGSTVTIRLSGDLDLFRLEKKERLFLEQLLSLVETYRQDG